jgi:hypothetical protein
MSADPGAASRAIARDWRKLSDDTLASSQDAIAGSLSKSLTVKARRRGITGKVKVTKRGAGARQETRIRVDSPAIILIVSGAKRHMIRPKRARALHLLVGGSRPFATAVRHPGFAPDPIVGRTLDAADGDIGDALDKAGSRLLGELARRVEG